MARLEFSHRSIHGAPRGRRRLLVATVLALAIFGIDVLSGGVVRSGVRSVAVSLMGAVNGSMAGIGRSGIFSTRASLASENQELASQVAALSERAAAYDALKQENDLLRSILNLSQLATGITAPVVSSYHASPYGTFTIGAGAREGVGKDDMVVTEGGFVVGRVVDVQRTTTLVRGIFASGASIDVVFGDAAMTAVGEGGGNARVSVPRGVDVQVGDAVFAPALGGRPVGVVGKVEELPTTAEQRVYISVPINLSVMRYVYVIPSHD